MDIPRIQPIVIEDLGIELFDMRERPDAEQNAHRIKFFEDLVVWMKEQRFARHTTCIDMECYQPLADEFIVQRRRGGSNDWERFQRDNFDRVLPDYLAKPWLPVLGLGMRRPGARDPSAVWGIMISNIHVRSATRARFEVDGRALMTLPDGADGTRWGRILEFLLDTDIPTVDGPVLDFVEWSFPTHPDARYVDRPATPFGGDVVRKLSEARTVEVDGSGVPTRIQKATATRVEVSEPLQIIRRG